MSTNMRKTAGRVTHTHTQVISRNKLDRGFYAHKTYILDNIKLVIQPVKCIASFFAFKVKKQGITMTISHVNIQN